MKGEEGIGEEGDTAGRACVMGKGEGEQDNGGGQR